MSNVFVEQHWLCWYDQIFLVWGFACQYVQYRITRGLAWALPCRPAVASLVRLVRPWPDHFSGGHWSILRLQRQSEDETIGPGVPRKLAFALRVRVSRNSSRSFAGGSGARRGPTGLDQHPRILIPQVVFTAAHCLLQAPPSVHMHAAHARVIFYLQWPDHF